MHPYRRLPRPLAERARAFAAAGAEAATPVDAATTVLLRDAASGLEVYLLRRHSAMPFAAGMYAFPGGGLDPLDHAQVGWAGPSPALWAKRLQSSEELARALVGAAVRETFEESGVLLAGPTPDTVVEDVVSEDWEAHRQRLVRRALSLADLLSERGLVLRSDLLAPWARWVTPVFEPRRYDTRFFVALLPAAQRARDVSGEADEARWLLPAAAVAAADAGELAVLPPTYAVLAELAGFTCAADVLNAAGSREVVAVRPEVIVVAGEPVLRLGRGEVP